MSVVNYLQEKVYCKEGVPSLNAPSFSDELQDITDDILKNITITDKNNKFDDFIINYITNDKYILSRLRTIGVKLDDLILNVKQRILDIA